MPHMRAIKPPDYTHSHSHHEKQSAQVEKEVERAESVAESGVLYNPVGRQSVACGGDRTRDLS